MPGARPGEVTRKITKVLDADGVHPAVSLQSVHPAVMFMVVVMIMMVMMIMVMTHGVCVRVCACACACVYACVPVKSHMAELFADV